MAEPRNPAPTAVRFARWSAGLLATAVLAFAGCGGPATGEVSGTVTVDGQPPAEGSSITFVPTGDNKSPGGGSGLNNGKYAVTLTTGNYKVEIRVPRPLKAAGKPRTEGPGPSGPANIEESLPAKYNDKTELTFEVKSGKNEKNWDLTTK